MKTYLLPREGRFFKTNLHMHTTVSDGQMTPEETKRAYLAQGYSVVAFTDHEVIVPHSELTDERFLALTGFEIAVNLPHPSSRDFEFMTTCHMNFYAKRPDNVLCPAFREECIWTPHTHAYVTDAMRARSLPREYSAEGFCRLIAAANEAGFLVTLNHPVWSRQNYPHYAGIRGLWGVEVFNSLSMLDGYGETAQPLDDLLRLGQHPLPVAADDAHRPRDCFHGYVMLKAKTLGYGDIIRAMERGDMYASTGPAIEELYLEDGVVHIATSPAAEIVLSTERRFSVRADGNGALLQGARLDIGEYLRKSASEPDAGKGCYFRITVRDAAGRCAWSRAYFTDELF